MTDYQPSQKILQKYADVLVNFCLNNGRGVKPGEIVDCVVPDVAKPLGLAIHNAILSAGAQPLFRLIPTGFDKHFYALANHQQLTFFPKKYLKSRLDLIDHQIGIIADPDPFELKTTPPGKIILTKRIQKPYRDWRDDKEVQGKFTWTLALWATSAQARLVGLSLIAYWQQIIKACFLDSSNPLAHWRSVLHLQQKIINKLNDLNIQTIKITGPNINLKLTIGSNRIWKGIDGRNLPSFEIFTSPDWRGTEGYVNFNQPLFRYGNKISGIYLEFKSGRVIKARAKINNRLLQEILKTKNANKLGEVSLTDKRMSRITHIMAETLFDENIGGQYGNTHVAIGTSFKDCCKGNTQKLTTEDLQKKGFNNSAEHLDIISTEDRTVTATLASGVQKIIYQKGRFTL